MTPSLKLLAAGSLKSAFIPLLARFQQQTGIPVDVHFGPAGLLRERIEAGEPCSVFASANSHHPQALRQAGLAGECYWFARNQLMLTVRRDAKTEAREWLTLLSDPACVWQPQRRAATLQATTPGSFSPALKSAVPASVPPS
ncbi:substrate-binding domain-containing protein [Klebsiella oxytoca]|nr:substrate-binding domain-containing protein [Klebsiella oxytoca]HDX8880553.1 substrate-binding domain-containing protein [Klebsiella oxytoca]HDX9100941.1 substrate-binding domain-containing protein [Klebsiella oxytoca]